MHNHDKYVKKLTTPKLQKKHYQPMTYCYELVYQTSITTCTIDVYKMVASKHSQTWTLGTMENMGGCSRERDCVKWYVAVF